MVERDSWSIPWTYGDPQRERKALREGVGLLDISEQGKIDVKGEGVEAILQAALPDVDGLEVGAAAEGDGLTVYRLTNEQALVLTPPTSWQPSFETLQRIAGQHQCAHVTDMTSALCGLRLLGPRAPDVMQRISALDLARDRFADGFSTQGAVAKTRALVARRDGPEATGYDLYVDRDLGGYLWDAVLEAGGPLGLRSVGRQAEEPD